jgi:hypothetical protein
MRIEHRGYETPGTWLIPRPILSPREVAAEQLAEIDKQSIRTVRQPHLPWYEEPNLLQ